MQHQGGITIRRLVFPLVIVGVAIGLGVWGSQTGGARSDVVQRFVKQVCLDIAGGGDATILLGATDSLVAEGVRRQIAIVLEAHGGQPDLIDVDVFAGDIHPYPGSESATHSVLVGDGNVHMLGLRVSCRSDSSAVRVLGYWVPMTN